MNEFSNKPYDPNESNKNEGSQPPVRSSRLSRRESVSKNIGGPARRASQANLGVGGSNRRQSLTQSPSRRMSVSSVHGNNNGSNNPGGLGRRQSVSQNLPGRRMSVINQSDTVRFTAAQKKLMEAEKQKIEKDDSYNPVMDVLFSGWTSVSPSRKGSKSAVGKEKNRQSKEMIVENVPDVGKENEQPTVALSAIIEKQ